MKRYLVTYHYPDSEPVTSFYGVEDDQPKPTKAQMEEIMQPDTLSFGELTVDSIVSFDPFEEPSA